MMALCSLQRLVLAVIFFFAVSSCSPSVTIVGAGIGGGSCAYYLRQFLGTNVSIDVYDANNYIGGRINEIVFGGQLEEIGADAWSPVNYYIESLQEELGIEIGNDTYVGNGQVGIWSGEFADWKKLIVRNARTDKCLSTEIQSFIDSLTENYAERQENAPFTTINEFLAYGNMTKYTQEDFSSFLSQKCGASPEYMDTLVAPIVRAIYDQPMNLTSFGGEVSLLAIFTPAKWAANGNSQLPKSLLRKSTAHVHLASPIDSISWDGTQFELSFNETESVTSEFVVIAAPIEKTGINFTNIEFYEPISDRNFVHCFVTHVQASGIDPTYFGLDSSYGDMPDSILTTPESTLPFTIIGIEDPSLTLLGANIYKIFSNTDITEELASLFVDLSDYHVHDWEYTFPDLKVTNDFQPILLAPNLYYLNTMESTVTAMEGSVIAGRNVAQLLAAIIE